MGREKQLYQKGSGLEPPATPTLSGWLEEAESTNMSKEKDNQDCSAIVSEEKLF